MNHLDKQTIQSLVDQPTQTGHPAYRHILQCASCKKELDDFILIKKGLSHSPAYLVPANLASKILSKIVSEPGPLFSRFETWSLVLVMAAGFIASLIFIDYGPLLGSLKALSPVRLFDGIDPELWEHSLNLNPKYIFFGTAGCLLAFFIDFLNTRFIKAHTPGRHK